MHTILSNYSNRHTIYYDNATAPLGATAVCSQKPVDMPALVPALMLAPLPEPLPYPLPADQLSLVLLPKCTILIPQQVTSSLKKFPGTKSKLRRKEHIILLSELAFVKAHVAPAGQTREENEISASNINATKILFTSILWKTLQDRYRKLQSKNDQNKETQSQMSGLAQKVVKEEDLLATMYKDFGIVVEEKSAKKDVGKKRNWKEEHLGSTIRSKATVRKALEVDFERK